MSIKNNGTHCGNCGAPITTEVCPYCHAATGIDTKYADMEYPVIECKEATVNFWLVVFPMIFAVAFGFGGCLFNLPFFLFSAEDKSTYIFLVAGCFMWLISIVAFIIAMKSVVRYLYIKSFGKEIEATVYGYIDDNVLINGNPCQIVKLLVSTNDGLKFILYQLGDVKQPFKINSKIKLKVYKDIFYIENKKQYYF